MLRAIRAYAEGLRRLSDEQLDYEYRPREIAGDVREVLDAEVERRQKQKADSRAAGA